MEYVASIIIVMLVSMTAYLTITFRLKVNNRIFLTGAVLGLKFLIYLAYLFIMILFFDISDKKTFVFTFMFVYLAGTFQLSYILKNKLKSQ